MNGPERRLPGLDGLRGIAVLFVLFSHVFASEGWVYSDWLFQLQRTFSGMFGVQIFFTISGFIITHLLLREKERDGGIGLKKFWLRRALRILPPAAAYLLFLHLLMVSQMAPVPAETQWGSLLFYRNLMPHVPWFTTDQGFTGHYWTLSVEEQFYLFWPLLVALLPLRNLQLIAWGGVALSVLLRMSAASIFPEGHERWLFTNLDGFMAGGLVAIAHRQKMESYWVKLWSWRWPLLIFAFACTRVYASVYSGYVAGIQPVAAAAAAGVWIAGLIRAPAGIEARFLNSRPLVALGLISYSLYLWQQVWLAPPFQWSSGHSPWLGVYPQNVLVCLACGTLSYLLIERPCMRLKDWLLSRRPVAADADLPNARVDLH